MSFSLDRALAWPLGVPPALTYPSSQSALALLFLTTHSSRRPAGGSTPSWCALRWVLSFSGWCPHSCRTAARTPGLGQLPGAQGRPPSWQPRHLCVFPSLLQNFYKSEINKEEMYIRYIHKLCDMHLQAENYTGEREWGSRASR